MKKYLSICSGIEAATVAWHGLGWEPVGFAEIEPFPAAVLAHHYPGVPNFGDMTNFREWDCGTVDIVVGGTPCQAFSVAGLRRGLADKRGNLALTFCELVDHFDPEVVVWENVPGVLSSKDNAFGCFLAGLVGADEPIVPGGKWERAGVVSGPKRTAAWRVLDAQYFGVAQRRRRVFVVAFRGAGNWRAAAALFPVGESLFGDTPPSREAWQEVAGTIAVGARKRGGFSRDDIHSVASGLIASNAEGATGLPFLTASNVGKHVNNQTPLIAFDTTQITSPDNRSNPQPGDPCHPLAAGSHPPAIAFSSKGHGADASEELAPTLRAMNHNESHANGGGQMVVAHAFDARQSDVIQYGDKTGPLDTHGHTIGVLARQGGSAQDQVISPDGVSPTLAHSSCAHGGHNEPNVMMGMQVRRLTPRECERLQGFPDDYTLIPHGRRIKPEKLDQDFIKYQMRGSPRHLTRDDIDRLAADGPRYKALGNSMAVPVMGWIGRRIAFVLRAY